jgi:hypothetical protein
MRAPRLAGWRLRAVARLLELPFIGASLARRAARELGRDLDLDGADAPMYAPPDYGER